MFLSKNTNIQELRLVDELYDYKIKPIKKITETDYTEAYVSVNPIDGEDIKHLTMLKLN